MMRPSGHFLSRIGVSALDTQGRVARFRSALSHGSFNRCLLVTAAFLLVAGTQKTRLRDGDHSRWQGRCTEGIAPTILSIQKLERGKPGWSCSQTNCRNTPAFRLRINYFLCPDHAHEFHRAVRDVNK
jgi:hypothetical protein